MNNFIKIIGFVVLFILVSVYCVKSIYSLKESKVQLKTLIPQYSNLLIEQQNLNLEISVLHYKVNGIRENSLNVEVLEDRVKTMLNLKKSDEILLTN